jgi:hypothetical protein
VWGRGTTLYFFSLCILSDYLHYSEYFQNLLKHENFNNKKKKEKKTTKKQDKQTKNKTQDSNIIKQYIKINEKIKNKPSKKIHAYFAY